MPPLRSRRGLLATGLALHLLVPATGRAQTKVELTPVFASYFAAGKTRSVADNDQERQESAPAVGARLWFRLTGLLAIEGSAVFAFSGIVPRDPGFVIQPQSGHILLASGRLVLQPRRTPLYFLAGAGIVKRGGKAWDVPGLEDLTDIAGVAGFGIRASVSPNFSFKLAVEANVYRSDFDGSLPYYENRTQADVLVSIGVPINLVGR